MSLRPARWRKFRTTLLDSAGHACQFCARPHRLLHLTRLSFDPTNWTTVAVLCPSCQARHHSPQRIALIRRRRAEQRGQLWLWSELEFAPLPVRLWPDHVRQLPLF